MPRLQYLGLKANRQKTIPIGYWAHPRAQPSVGFMTPSKPERDRRW